MELKKTDIEDLKNELKGGGYIFENEAETELTFQRTDIYLSTFKRIGLKECDIQNSTFSQCIFDNVYARKGNFTDVHFTGSTFIDCNFHGATLSSCTFKYCKFIKTDIPPLEIKNCLPNEYNLRNDLCRNLKVNYLSIGEKKISDTYLKLEITALKNELFAIFYGETEYYKKKYKTIERIKSFIEYMKLKLSGFFYGHGINVWMLLFSYLICSSILTILILWYDGTFIQNNQNAPIGIVATWLVVFGESIKYSFMSYIPGNTPSIFISHIARLLGLFYLGLLTATIYRRIAR